jgi:hypothetical protein
VRWPVVRWPVVRWPVVRWPVVRWPVVRWPVVRWPVVRWPVVRWPAVRWPVGAHWRLRGRLAVPGAEWDVRLGQVGQNQSSATGSAAREASGGGKGE